MIKLFVTLIVLGLAVVGGLFLYNSTMKATGSIVDEFENVVDTLEIDNVEINTIGGTDAKTFVLTGENFKYFMDDIENPEIKVSEGDLVRVEFSSVGGFHDWVLEEFGAATEKVGEDGKTYVEFVADKKGTYEYYCSVGQHRENGMKGVFVVE